MNLPFLNSNKKSTQFTQVFRGYNHSIKHAPSSYGQEDESYFYDMKNLTLDDFPIIRTRDGRDIIKWSSLSRESINGNTLFVFDGKLITTFDIYLGYFDLESGTTSGFQIICEVTNTEKQYASIGNYVYILPDHLVLKSTETGFTYERVAQSISSSDAGLAISMKLMLADIDEFGQPCTFTYTESWNPPTDPTNNPYWLDQSTNTMKKYSAMEDAYVAFLAPFYYIENYYQNIRIKNFFDKFKTGDTVNITRLIYGDQSQTEKQKILDTIAKNDSDEEGKGDTLVVQAVEGNENRLFFRGTGVLKEPITGISQWEFNRRVPDMDYITSANNRIWGCSSDKHEVYCSKLGDPAQWYNFAGIASDSYAATVPNMDRFTGAASLNTYVLFFTETKLFKVYGDFPSNFQIVSYNCEGVEDGSHASIAEVNGALFYKGINSVMIYDGSYPRPFATDIFGNVKYKNAVAAAARNKYYIRMQKSATDECEFFVYDTELNAWVKEDEECPYSLAVYKNKILGNIVMEGVQPERWFLYITRFPSESLTDTSFDSRYPVFVPGSPIEWMADTGELGFATPNQKYVSRINMRVEFTGTLRVYIGYDDGEMTKVYDFTSETLRSHLIPIRVRRCDHYRIRIEGEGHMKLYSYGYQYEQGSDRPQC